MEETALGREEIGDGDKWCRGSDGCCVDLQIESSIHHE